MLVKPQVSDPVLRVKLSKGMGHNTYGEIAWPNDLLYMFPVCILGVLGISTSLAVFWHLPSAVRLVSPSRRQATGDSPLSGSLLPPRLRSFRAVSLTRSLASSRHGSGTSRTSPLCRCWKGSIPFANPRFVDHWAWHPSWLGTS